MRRWLFKSDLKVGRLTAQGGWILKSLKRVEAAGTDRVAVKCIEMIQNPDCVGS